MVVDLASHAEHDAENAGCAAALASALGVPEGDIVAGLEAFVPAPLRIEVHTSPTGITLINDSYSADPGSMRSALQTLRRLSDGRRSIAVLGAMRDLGEESESRHRQVGREVAELGVDLLVAVGERARPIATEALAAGIPAQAVLSAPDNSSCAELLDRHLKSGDVVLVKASRPLQLERTAHHLLESLSPTRLYIDLGVIAENVRRVRAWIGSDVALFAVVKSFGYGSDAIRVSELLEQQKVAYLMVAYPDEGAQLRRRGINTPILVSNVLPGEVDKVARHRLSAVVYSNELLQALSDVAVAHDMTIPIHIKLDTGMGRFGLLRPELRSFAERCISRPGIELEGLMSHLSVADESDEDDYSREQIASFESAVEELRRASLLPRYAHLANSAGLLRFKEAHFNAVRLGLGLYGCLERLTGPQGSPELSPAISLHSRLVGIRELEKGNSVGYGRTFRTTRQTRIGLVALGYNDGLPRSLSNKGDLWIRGQRVPIVGRISMDVTAIDLTDVPEASVGDDVVVFNDGQHGEPTVLDVAQWAGTIPYEILCRVSPRVRRIARLAD